MRDRPVFNIFKEHRTTVALAEPLVACVWAGFDDPRTIVHGGYADQGGGPCYRR